MLRLTGKVLDVTTENVTAASGSFVSTTIHVLDGLVVQRVRVGRDFPMTELPRKGEDADLSVSVSAYSGRNGAGFNLTALALASPGHHAGIAPAPAKTA